MSLSAVSTTELEDKIRSCKFLLAKDGGVDRGAMWQVIRVLRGELRNRAAELVDCSACKGRGYLIVRKKCYAPKRYPCRGCGGEGRIVRKPANLGVAA